MMNSLLIYTSFWSQVINCELLIPYHINRSIRSSVSSEGKKPTTCGLFTTLIRRSSLLHIFLSISSFNLKGGRK